MGVHRINTAPGIPRYRQRTVLDGREYVLVFRWSEREERWYLDLRDARGAALVLGIALVQNWPLLYRYRALPTIPPGELMVIDGRNPSRPPALNELGDVSQLVYCDIAELAARVV